MSVLAPGEDRYAVLDVDLDLAYSYWYGDRQACGDRGLVVESAIEYTELLQCINPTFISIVVVKTAYNLLHVLVKFLSSLRTMYCDISCPWLANIRQSNMCKSDMRFPVVKRVIRAAASNMASMASKRYGGLELDLVEYVSVITLWEYTFAYFTKYFVKHDRAWLVFCNFRSA